MLKNHPELIFAPIILAVIIGLIVSLVFAKREK
jgi:type III secretory pathway component EscS